MYWFGDYNISVVVVYQMHTVPSTLSTVYNVKRKQSKKSTNLKHKLIYTRGNGHLKILEQCARNNVQKNSIYSQIGKAGTVDKY